MASGDFRYLLTVFRICPTPWRCPAPFNSYISFTSATFSNAPVHLREGYADDDTYLRWVNSNLLLLHSLELLVTISGSCCHRLTDVVYLEKEHEGGRLSPCGMEAGWRQPDLGALTQYLGNEA